MTREMVLYKVIEERARQDVIHPAVASEFACERSRLSSKDLLEAQRVISDNTDDHITKILEEVFEAGAETDESKQQEEIIQIIALCFRWLESR